MKKRIVCYGDSNTWGYCPTDGSRYGEDVRWTGRLQRLLGDGYTVIEEGQNGRATVWNDPVENRMAGIDYLWPCMDSHHPFDLLILMLGTNDAKHYYGMQPRNIAEGAGRLVEMAQKSEFGPNFAAPQVLLVSPAAIEYTDAFAHMFGAQAVEKARAFPAEFRAVAEARGCHFLDAAQFVTPCPEDGVHLSPAAHAALAQALCEKVREILK